MYENQQLWIAQADTEEKEHICIVPTMANRHGLVAGATGTGKTVTLKVLAETFADAGVPVFLADMKGDVSGISQPGIDTPKMQQLIAGYGFEHFEYRGYTSCFWDIFGEKGIPLRTTISEMGPTLLARLMDLNQTQEDILTIIFRIADDNQLLLLDMKDLREMVKFVAENSKEFSTEYGNMSAQSLGAISRNLVALESQGAEYFFGEPAINIKDWMRCDTNSRGIINILDATKLIGYPKLYSTFMLWMLSELYEVLPEAGDLDKPKMVFIFDEAHLLFHDAPKALLEKITQIVKLIRSKGIGIYFCSQNPSDIPDEVLSQLGNRIQHALRAYTPADQKAVKAAAQSFRVNPEFKTEDVITQLGIGQALVSFLDENGAPQMVQKAHILCPQGRMDAATEEERRKCVENSDLNTKYRDAVDRESAYEILGKRFAQAAEEEQRAKEEMEAAKRAAEEAKAAEKKAKEEARAAEKRAKEEAKAAEKEAREQARQREKEERERVRKETERARRSSAALQRGMNSAMTTLGREVTRSLVRGIMNTLKK